MAEEKVPYDRSGVIRAMIFASKCVVRIAGASKRRTPMRTVSTSVDLEPTAELALYDTVQQRLLDIGESISDSLSRNGHGYAVIEG